MTPRRVRQAPPEVRCCTSPDTLTGTCAAPGTLLALLEDAITARSQDSWHLHADETSRHVFAPREGDGPAKWWLWVFIGPDTTCFVMDPNRSAGSDLGAPDDRRAPERGPRLSSQLWLHQPHS